ncbi:MAG TPA: AMP-binding protein [Myxococcota bacterium]|nr:AMP-binding protein [Myxococcota bacterium]
MLDPVAGWTVGRLLAERARTGGGRSFCVVQPLDDGAPAQHFTLADADARATDVARGLLTLGLGSTDRVVVHLPNGGDFLWAWLGAARAGVTMVATNLRSATEELGWMAGHARAAAVVTDEGGATRHAAAWGGRPVVTVDELRARGREVGAPSVPGGPERGGAAREDDDCAVLYTSGSTSRPKGVRLSHAAYVWAGRLGAALTRLTPEDRHLVVNPLFHVNAQTYSTMPVLWAGASMALCERFSASRYLRWARAHGCTAASVVTAQVRILLTRDPPSGAAVPAGAADVDERALERAHGLRWIGGAAVMPALEERLGVETVGWYGMTETVTTPLCSGRGNAPGRRAGYVGTVSPGYRVRLRATGGGLVERPGEVGALEVEGVPGRTLMTGYLDDEAATRAAFGLDEDRADEAATRAAFGLDEDRADETAARAAFGLDEDRANETARVAFGRNELRAGAAGRVWLRTGDLVAADEAGQVRFVGRAKDMIKVGGENVAALEVERALCAHPAVLEAAAIGVPDPVLDEVVKAYVVLRDGAAAAPAPEELRAHCRALLADFKVPCAVEVRPELPRVTLDKIDKNALRYEERLRREGGAG